MIESFKSMADYVSKKTGRTMTAEAVRAIAKRDISFRASLDWLNGRVAAPSAALDDLISRMRGKRLRRAA